MRKNRAVYVVFKDYNAAILSTVHYKSIGGVKPDVVAITGELSHQVGSAANRWRPAWKAITKVKERIFGNCVEEMLAVNKAG